jgi:acyl-CoA thioester hydrolase
MQPTVYRHRLRVYWEDTDAGGVVFYANHLKFFERARTEWLRAAGYSQERLRVDHQRMFVVAETRVRYLRPARLDDLLEVSVEPLNTGRAGMTLAQQTWRVDADGHPGPCLCEGEIRIGCVDAGTFRPSRIPTDLLAALAATA